jgi:hypothetical protein
MALGALERGDAVADLDEVLVTARGATDEQTCALATATSLLMPCGPIPHVRGGVPVSGRPRVPSPRGLVLPKIVDWDEDAGRFVYDESYARKRLAWTYAYPRVGTCDKFRVLGR